jgi:hypothetical protein
MKLQLTFYKESGKFYSSGEVEIQDGLLPWDDTYLDALLENQKIVTNPRQFNIVVDEVAGEEYPAFFKSLYTIRSMNKKAVQGRTHPPFREATAAYDELVLDRFKWDNLSNGEQELLESYIMKTSYYGEYSSVFKTHNPVEDFMSFYDRVVVNYHNIEK